MDGDPSSSGEPPVFWTVMAFSMTSGAPGAGAFGVARVVFPLFGVVFTRIAIGWGIHCVLRAHKYQVACQAYQDRRARAARG